MNVSELDEEVKYSLAPKQIIEKYAPGTKSEEEFEAKPDPL